MKKILRVSRWRESACRRVVMRQPKALVKKFASKQQDPSVASLLQNTYLALSRQILVSFILLQIPLFAAGLNLGFNNPVQFTVTDHFIFSHERDPIQRNLETSNLFLHEDYIRAELDNYAAEIQITNRFAPDLGDAETRAFTLEKKTLHFEWEQWVLELGDSDQEFGRGIALALYRDEVFGIHNSLEGASLVYRPKNLNLRLIGGRVNTLTSPVAINPQIDPLGSRDFWLLGASTKISIGDNVKLGAHYLLSLNDPDEQTTQRFDRIWNTIGITANRTKLVKDVDLYMESNVLFGQRLRGDEYETLPTGHGSYGALVWSPFPWIIKAEIKDYRNFVYDFNRPPTLELDIVETQYNEDVTAGKLKVERKDILKKTSYYASYLLGEDRTQDSLIHHPVVGTKFPIGNLGLELRSGFRWLPDQQETIHGSVSAKLPTFKGQSIDFSAQKKFSKLDLQFLPREEDRNLFHFTYTFSRALNMTLGFEYVPTNSAEEGKQFFSFAASMKLGSLVARTFIGETSGGTLCSAGVCREVPAYTGARLETIYTF